jgi:2-polyprenyl-3-methyl-5-hydroxy-6-metoxy-1,4-benzoquinol methylase
MKIKILNSHLENYKNLYDVDYDNIINCPVCDNGVNQELITSVEGKNGAVGLQITKCNACSHIYHSRPPTKKWLSTYYLDKWDSGNSLSPTLFSKIKSTFNSNKLLHYFVKRISIFKNRINQNKILFKIEMLRGLYPIAETLDELPVKLKILEVGCGYGYALELFRDFGFDSYGIEANSARVAECNRRGLNVRLLTSSDLSPLNNVAPFDLIYSCHVFEHISDLKELMRNCISLLSDDGLMYIEVPNAIISENIFYRAHSPAHCHLFSIKSLEYLFTSNGMKVVRVFADYNIHIIASKKETNTQGINLKNEENINGYLYGYDWVRSLNSHLEFNFDHFNIDVNEIGGKNLFKRTSHYPAVKRYSDHGNMKLSHTMEILIESSEKNIWPIKFVHDSIEPPLFFKQD